MSGRGARERAEDDRLRYDNGVFRNKLDIQVCHLLQAAERYFAAERSRRPPLPEAQSITTDGLKSLHEHLFQDVYEWAGQFRSHTTDNGIAPFALPEQIQPWLDQQFRALRSENNLRGLSSEKFSIRAAVYVGEINAAHPFLEGNGRTQRAWLRGLAEQAGHRLEVPSQDKDRWNEASRIGFEKNDPEPMASLINDRIGQTPEMQKERSTKDYQRKPLMKGREW